MTLKYIIYDSSYIKKYKMKKFINTVYYNFKHLSKYENLNHTKKDIKETVFKDDAYIIFCMNKKMNQLVGYLLGYTIVLNDGRKVFFISYIFVAKKYRSMGLGSKIITIVEEIATKISCNGIMLVCDTEDQKVYDFYLTKQFMPDLELRRYEKYDVLYKNV